MIYKKELYDKIYLLQSEINKLEKKLGDYQHLKFYIEDLYLTKEEITNGKTALDVILNISLEVNSGLNKLDENVIQKLIGDKPIYLNNIRYEKCIEQNHLGGK